ncbi:Hint domain-containing protein, partial [Acidocella sp.]|uniref:Hint domain-containing protein n=1 Tax=Acidocella sp. TaxID=50710 RepID=UPI0026065EE0
MSQTITYKFTEGKGSNATTISLSLTASTTPSTISSTVSGDTVTGTGYAVTAISGSIGNNKISGEYGNAGEVQSGSIRNNAVIFDNAIFSSVNNGGDYNGNSGSSYGLDVNGIEFTVGSTQYNLYEKSGKFYLYDLNNGTIKTLTLDSTDAPCFCAGTLISTPEGECNVEDLKAGDMVLTAAGEAKPVRWIGRRTV